jgi:uracil-DNA glycosylase
MFQERKGDQERAEMFALGLLKDEFSELILVPCRNPKKCPTHNPQKRKSEIKCQKQKN